MKGTHLEILLQLLEQPKDLLSQWRSSAYGETQTVL